MIRKRFDPALHAQTDNQAREAVKSILKDSGFNIVDNPKVRGVDLLVYNDKGKHVANIECEIKLVWKVADFPYENIQFPERKEKYAILDVPTVFVMFNADMSSYLTVTGDVLISSPKKEVPNRYVYKGVYFFQVPKGKVKFKDLPNVLKGVV